ncbi:hypothetical protein ZIOFF_007475 [Zingiber officinale]|uniref:AB hydrolase-1 domain-containing protein n=1 Tax=Zingiber officinale TaxID=94328 RepID=A0A8J5I1S0_ZINOF|nr:hypothetical protein ZIOFF_007475 [Zingiber officinale]
MASTKSFRHLLLLLAVALLSLFRRVVAAARRLLSFVSLRELLLHLSFLRCGLRPVTLDLGHASLHIWGPNPRGASRKPALLLIHDFGGNSKWKWERQIGALSRSFDLYIPDLLFFGRSRSSCADRSVGYLVRCVAEAMRLLGVARYSVMGISYGGFVAFRLAEMEAESVERVAILTAGICMSPEQLRVMSAKEKRDVCSSIIHQTNKLYDTQDSVTVIGYPLGGDTIAVTKGVVSRIEYAHGSSDLLSIQIDAAINPGNSGGPTFNDRGECIGVAFQVFRSEDTENIGYVIPTTVVSHFLDDYERNGKYTGFPSLGVLLQKLENPALREPSLHAAVMLEQASYCYLLSIPPMLRKYSFHLVLFGNCYYISDQRQHAIRAYRNALFVYRENGRSYISDHVHYNVGRFSMLCLYICAFIFDAFDLISFHLLTWYSFIGVLDLAIKHMLEVLACSHLSLTTQNVFLNEFSHVVQVLL